MQKKCTKNPMWQKPFGIMFHPYDSHFNVFARINKYGPFMYVCMKHKGHKTEFDRPWGKGKNVNVKEWLYICWKEQKQFLWRQLYEQDVFCETPCSQQGHRDS